MSSPVPHRTWYLAAVLLVNLMWAAQYPAYKIASEHMGSATLNFWTLTIAAALILPLALRAARGGRSASLRSRDLWDFTMLGLIGIIPPSVMLAWGVNHSSSSNAAILSTTIPVLIALMAVVLLGERLTPIRGASLVLALLGALIVSRSDLANRSFGKEMLAGNLVIFIAGAGSAFYNVYGKRLLERFSEAEVLLYGYIVAAMACIPIAVLGHEPPLWQIGNYPASVWWSIGVLGGLSWGLAMVLWMWVLKHVEASQASVSIYLLPVLGVALSAITLHEHLSRYQVAGGLLVLIGTIISTGYETRLERRRAVREEERSGASANPLT